MRPLPFGDWAMRIVCSVLLFASGYTLVGGSTFVWRIRDDVTPAGVQALVLIVSAVLAFGPLLLGRRYLAGILASGFILSGMGAYWWSSISWDELIVETEFTTTAPPTLLRYVHVASPAIVALLYVAASTASRMRTDYLRRGIDADEAPHAAAASFLAGMGTIVACMALAMGLWALLAAGTLQTMGALVPEGVPAIATATALALAAYLLGTRSWSGRRVRRPSRSAGGRGVLARIRGRRSPS